MSDQNAPATFKDKPPIHRIPRIEMRALTVLPIALAFYVGLSCFILQSTDLSNLRLQMDLSPVLTGTFALQVHVGSAVTTFAIGVFLLSGLPKGTRLHKRLGWSWVVFMASTAISSFFLVGFSGNQMSWIHGLSAWTVIVLPFAIAAARRHDVQAHAKHMRGLFFGGMLIAGLFSFLPGRTMWHVFFAV